MKALKLALTVLLGAQVTLAAAPVRPVLPFIEDDYPKALATARAKKLPLFIEAWAPW